jgi:hypothetical protein
MKLALKTSVVANVILAAMVFRLVRPGPGGAVENSVTSRTNIDSTAAPAVSAQIQPQPVRQFQWKQLESSDYRTYIANLRAIGCPRQTIRDIITADVDSLYAPRRQQLAAQVPAGPPLLRANALQMLGAKLDALNSEELSVLNALFGAPQNPDRQSAASNPAPPVRVQRDQSQDENVSLPLVFQNVDPAALKLNEDQMNDLAFLRQKFQEDVGGPNQNPDDPAYLKRWQAARPQNDQMLRAMLGDRVYDRMQSEADNHAPLPQ